MATIEFALPRFHIGQQVIDHIPQVGIVKKMEFKNGEWHYTLDLGDGAEAPRTEANIVGYFDAAWHRVGNPSARIV